MIALSIKQPWAHCILHCGKDIENRTWSTSFRGRLLIHASKAVSRKEYEEATRVLHQIHDGFLIPPFAALERGGIIGSVELIDCVNNSSSPWFFGPFGFVLRNPTPLPFIPWKGQLGFFEVPESLLHHVMQREVCDCCAGTGICTDIYGNEGSCLTCNGRGSFTCLRS